MLLLSEGTREAGLPRRLVRARRAIYLEIIGLASTKKIKTVIATLWPI